MNDLIPALAATVGPIVALAPVVYALRPQGGVRWLRTRPVPARQVLDQLAAEVGAGRLPSGPFGDTTRPSAWTVQPAHLTAARDLTGAFPVVRAA